MIGSQSMANPSPGPEVGYPTGQNDLDPIGPVLHQHKPFVPFVPFSVHSPPGFGTKDWGGVEVEIGHSIGGTQWGNEQNWHFLAGKGEKVRGKKRK